MKKKENLLLLVIGIIFLLSIFFPLDLFVNERVYTSFYFIQEICVFFKLILVLSIFVIRLAFGITFFILLIILSFGGSEESFKLNLFN